MLPHFFIGGAPKCGTTSLAATLADHPDIFIPPIKEVGFFQSDKWETEGLEWYQNFFSGQDGTLGEATPFYCGSELAVQRIAQTIPQAKWVYLLRNPIQRLNSHYWHRQRGGTETRELGEVLLAEQQSSCAKGYLVEQGFYAKHLRRLQAHFPSEQLLVLLLEDFRENEAMQLQKVYQFLGVESSETTLKVENQASEAKNQNLQKATLSFVKGNSLSKTLIKKVLGKQSRKVLLRKWNNWNSKAQAKPSLDPQIRTQLIDIYREDILQLEKLLQRDLSHWLAN